MSPAGVFDRDLAMATKGTQNKKKKRKNKTVEQN